MSIEQAIFAWLVQTDNPNRLLVSSPPANILNDAQAMASFYFLLYSWIMTGFSYELLDKKPGFKELVLSGYMNEQTNLPDLNLFEDCQSLVINFRQVKAILSIGIKKWIQFCEKLENLPKLKVEFIDCSKQVIDQINLVEGFLPHNAHVKSLFVPIFCEKCNRTFKIHKSTENIKSEIDAIIKNAEGIDCEFFPGCKENFEVEFNTFSFLKFLDRK